MSREATVPTKTCLAAAVLAFAQLLVPLAETAAQERPEANVLMQALRDELARSTEQLEIEGLEKPYFIAYTVREVERVDAAGSFGALLSSRDDRSRRLNVEVRVGDRAFDNTNFIGTSAVSSSFRGMAFLPRENDYREFRRQIWLATDRAYKAALEALAEKRAALQNETRAEDVTDFTTEDAFTYFDEAGEDLPPRTALEDLVRGLSASFKRMPGIFGATVAASARNRRTYYANSEGSAFVRSDPAASVVIEAHTQAEDGIVLNDSASAHGRVWGDVADPETLAGRVQDLGANLAARRTATTLDRYSGPVLFERQAAAELFAQAFMPRLLGSRVPDAEPRMARMLQQSRNPFLDRIGAGVLPRGLSVLDDPSLGRDGFLGGYEVDDDGVAARPKTLVENGTLRTLLTTRNPIAGIDGSSGNRRGGGPLPSNLVLTSSRAMDRERLLAEFMLLVEERGVDFGIVVRRMAKPSDEDGMPSAMSGLRSGPDAALSLGDLSLAYKVFPDGREELIPRAELVAVSEGTFRDIVGVSDRSTLYSFTYAPGAGGLSAILAGALSMDEVVTVSLPDLLFEEMSIRKPSGNAPHLPVAAHPYFDE